MKEEISAKEFKRLNSKGDMMRMLENYAMEIRALKYQLYMRDLLFNPCHEAQRIQSEW